LRFDTSDGGKGGFLPYVELSRTTMTKDGTVRPVRIWARLRPTMMGWLPREK
jgi:hypothetical protein